MSLEFNNYETNLKPICCGSCGSTPSNDEKLLRCSACRVIKYCNINCQRNHWSQCHKKDCKTIKRKMSFWEDQAKEQFEKANDATDMYIMGTRLALGNNDDLINHELACKLYEIATTSTKHQLLEDILLQYYILLYIMNVGLEFNKVILTHIDTTNQLLIILFLVKKILVLHL
jgi:hypothetical protein